MLCTLVVSSRVLKDWCDNCKHGLIVSRKMTQFPLAAHLPSTVVPGHLLLSTVIKGCQTPEHQEKRH